MTSLKTELMTKAEVCLLFGGASRPLHPATIYRMIKAGKLPKPIHVGASSRWLREECVAALAKLVEASR